MSKRDALLNHLYLTSDTPAFLGSVKKLTETAKSKNKTIRKPIVKNWLSEQEAHTLHRSVYRKFPRNHYNVYGIDKMWEIDLMDMSEYKNTNEEYKFILIAIDVFSKFIFAHPVKSKSAREITSTFRKIIDIDSLQQTGNKRQPNIVQSDRGREFVNWSFKSFLNSRGIKINYPITRLQSKAAICERAIRTIKMMLYKYFTSNPELKNKYIDILPKIIYVYNNSYHRTIKMTPASVNNTNVAEVFKNILASHQKSSSVKKAPDFFKGNLVRVARQKNVFEPGYKFNWSKEIFEIDRVINKQPYKLYKIKDHTGTVIREKFYGNELQYVNANPNSSVAH